MDNRQAKKVAYRCAAAILQSTREAGWQPRSNDSYSIFDKKRILEAMDEIIDQLWRRSSANNPKAKILAARKRS